MPVCANAFASSVPFRLHRRRLDRYAWCASRASIYPLLVWARLLGPGALKRLHARVPKSSGSAARCAILLNWLVVVLERNIVPALDRADLLWPALWRVTRKDWLYS